MVYNCFFDYHVFSIRRYSISTVHFGMQFNEFGADHIMAQGNYILNWCGLFAVWCGFFSFGAENSNLVRIFSNWCGKICRTKPIGGGSPLTRLITINPVNGGSAPNRFWPIWCGIFQTGAEIPSLVRKTENWCGKV